MCKITVSYDDEKKKKAMEYLKAYGLSMTDAISIFLDAVVMNQGMPNAAALEDAEDIRMANKAIEAEEKGRSKPVPAEIVYIRLGI